MVPHGSTTLNYSGLLALLSSVSFHRIAVIFAAIAASERSAEHSAESTTRDQNAALVASVCQNGESLMTPTMT
jgi:hypothetical protein